MPFRYRRHPCTLQSSTVRPHFAYRRHMANHSDIIGQKLGKAVFEFFVFQINSETKDHIGRITVALSPWFILAILSNIFVSPIYRILYVYYHLYSLLVNIFHCTLNNLYPIVNYDFGQCSLFYIRLKMAIIWSYLVLIIYICCRPITDMLWESWRAWWRHQMEAFLWLFVRGIHQSPVNSSHKSRWIGALMLSLIGPE